LATIVKRQPKSSRKAVYYYHETYRVKGEDGKKSKVKSNDIYLGSAEQVLEKIQNGQKPQQVSAKQFGLVMAAYNEAKRIGLVDVIDSVVPKRVQGFTVGEYILIAILNKIAAPTSRNGIRDWLKKTSLPEKIGLDVDLFTSQNFWDHFDLIMPEKELKERKTLLSRGEIVEEELFNDEALGMIEEGIWKNLLARESINLEAFLYDTTNFFSFMETTTPSFLARTGHNKHMRHNLRQVGMGLVLTREGSLPLMHLLFHGRKTDPKLFPGSMTELVDRYFRLTSETEKLVVVFDKGNNSRENIQFANDKKITAVGSLVPSHHRDLVGVRLSRYQETIEEKPVFVTKKKVFGLDCRIVVVYNEATYRRKKLKFREKIFQLKDLVEERFNEIKDRPKAEIEEELKKILWGNEYQRYIEVEVSGRRYKTLSCCLNMKNYLAKLRTFGKLIIFSTDPSMSSQEIVRLYAEKNEVEKQFKQLNDPNSIAFRPRYHWTDTKIKVYSLICVLALLILQLMNYRARKANLIMSNKVLIEELSDIFEVVMVYSFAQVEKQITELSSVQKKLFNLFELGLYAP